MATVPDAPILTAVTPGASQLVLTLTAPSNNGGATIQYYQYSLDGGATAVSVWVPTVAGAGISAQVVNLTVGQSYNVQVRAVNSVGAGAWSNVLSGTPSGPQFWVTVWNQYLRVAFNPLQLPTVVPGYALSSPGVPGAAIWTYVGSTPPVSGFSTDWNFRAYNPDDLNPGFAAILDGSIVTDASVSAYDGHSGNLQKASAIGLPQAPFWSTAIGDCGRLRSEQYPPPLTDASTVQIDQIYLRDISSSNRQPGTPTINSVTTSNGSVTINYTAPASSGLTPIYAYGVWIGTTTPPADAFIPTEQYFAPTGTMTISGLTNGTTYYGRLVARNQQGNSSVAASFTIAVPIQPPGAPTIQYIVPNTDALAVTFAAPADDGGSAITSYQYRVDGGSPVTLPSLATTFTISGLENGTSYTVEVRAVNAVGAGAWSTPVAQTPATPVPVVEGWGRGDWGESGWGTGLEAISGLGAGRAYSVGDRVVRVELPFEPQHADSSVFGDATNPKTWRITADNTGRIITPMSVATINRYTYEILTLQLLESAAYTMTLDAEALLLRGGAVLAPLSWQFQGSQLVSNTTNQAKTTAAGLALRDVANPQTPNSPVGGTLQITAGGDYKPVTGEALVRKLIIRRLISKKGDFFHLPNYGAGLRVKDVIATTDMRKLATEIERQVQLEPEVEAAAVSLSYTAAASALVVQLQVRLRQTGQDVSVSFAVPSGTMQL